MAIQVGRLRPVGFAKRGAVPSSVIVAGTFTSPTHFLRYLPPWTWYPTQPPLESPAHSGVREMPVKAVKGPMNLNALKLNAELEPTPAFGHLHMAAFGQDTVTGDGLAAPSAHNFDALESAQLPVYDFWHHDGNAQMGFAAMMAGKFDLIAEFKQILRTEMEWTGLFYVDALALSPVQSYSALRPLPFATMDITLGGSLVTGLRTARISVDNGVVADHSLRSDTNQPTRIWTEKHEVSASVEAYYEDATEYNKFLAMSSPSAPSESSLLMVSTSPETFTEGLLTQSYVWRYLMPRLVYRTAEKQLPSGVVVITLEAVALPGSSSIGSGGNAYAFTNKSLVAQFVNGVATPF